MVNGIKIQNNCGLYYLFIKKHYCPTCQNLLERKKREKIVNSRSPEAKHYDFSADDGVHAIGNIKFITYYYECLRCQTIYETPELQWLEKTKRKKKK